MARGAEQYGRERETYARPGSISRTVDAPGPPWRFDAWRPGVEGWRADHSAGPRLSGLVTAVPTFGHRP